MRLGILISVLAAGVGAAQDSAGQDRSGQDSGELPPLPVIDCYCTDRSGGRVDLGETICLIVGGRAYLARCEMSLNNPMWRDTGADCVGAKLRPGAAQSPAQPVQSTAHGGA